MVSCKTKKNWLISDESYKTTWADKPVEAAKNIEIKMLLPGVAEVQQVGKLKNMIWKFPEENVQIICISSRWSFPSHLLWNQITSCSSEGLGQIQQFLVI